MPSGGKCTLPISKCDRLKAAGTLVKNLPKKPKRVLKVTLEKELGLGDVSDDESVADEDFCLLSHFPRGVPRTGFRDIRRSYTIPQPE